MIFTSLKKGLFLCTLDTIPPLTAQAQPHGPIAPKAMPSSPSTESLLYFGWLSKTYQRMFHDIYKSTLLNDLNVLNFFELFAFVFLGAFSEFFSSVASNPGYCRQFCHVFFSYRPGPATRANCTEGNAIFAIHRIFVVFWMVVENISENVP